MNILNKIIRKIIIIFRITILNLQYKRNLCIGKNFSFRKRFDIRIRGNAKLTIGNNVFFNNDCSLNCMGEIEIGDDCIFGENIKIYDHNHKFRDKKILIRKQGYKVKKVRIGNNCWFGSNVIILPGVTIGDNVVIGAGCTIYNDIPDNSIIKNIQNQEIRSI